MSTDKTLADVQPGGMVRLGDHVLSTSEGARRYVADYFATQLSRHDFGDYILTELAADFACALAHHLSAQTSPGGQDALAEAACRVISDVDSGDYGGTISMATYDALVSALAARQPVDLRKFRDLIGFAALAAINLPETDPRRDFIRQANEFAKLIDSQVSGNG